jgi:glycoside hydrolase-like protein
VTRPRHNPKDWEKENMKKRGLLLLVLVLAACESAPPPAVVAPKALGWARGIDLPIDSRDVSSELRGSRLDFVARYYRDPASRWPTLSAEEARMVSGAGMSLVAVWESHSHKRDYFSYASGYADGVAAHRQAKAIGQPAGSAIYFAVDFNAQEPDVRGPVDQYFRGVHAGLAAEAGEAREYRVGVYGSGAVCDYMKRMRLAEYAWLSNSTAWSGYDDFTDWNIKQSGRSPLLSFDQDENEARGEFGGFQVPNQYSSL